MSSKERPSGPAWITEPSAPPPVERMADVEILAEWTMHRNSIRGLVLAEEYMKRQIEKRRRESNGGGAARV